MNDVTELCWNVIPWISEQATCLARDIIDTRLAELGCQLLILRGHISFLEETGMDSLLIEVAKLMDKACLAPKHKGKNETTQFAALHRILKFKGSKQTGERILIDEVRRSLPHFVQKNPEYQSLLRLISDCMRDSNSLDGQPDEQIQLHPVDREIMYSPKINDAVYTQLRLYSTCSCHVQHLESTRLRLDTESSKLLSGDIPFDVLFVAKAPSCLETECEVEWKEGKISVARPNEPRKKKKVAFAAQTNNPSSESWTDPSTGNLRKIELGEFCRLIGNDKGQPIHFHIHNNAMKLANTARDSGWRMFVQKAGIPLANWLDENVHLSNRVKVTLAYTIARSVWQYYSSSWMMKPWTNEHILLVREKIAQGSYTKPHPYFTTKLEKSNGQIRDYCDADDVLHTFPNILALGIVLIEIGSKQSFKPQNRQHPWNELTINDYFDWAMRTANSFGFDKSIGPPYKAAVQSCLDAELFRDGPIDPARFEKDLEIRREVLYEKVVLPLRGLYHAYKDDWEIQDSPKPTISPSPATSHKERSRRDKAPERRQFTVAIFCALETEADAVTEAFDEIWNEKCESYENAGPDNNRYTRGRILEHNVILVHMIGPGKRCASEAAAGLRCTYPEIKLILVVGICGGVPSRSERKGELILGDIVISEKVVQYDLGRQFSDRFATKSGLEASSRPGPRILGILSKMKVTRERERIEKQISQHLRTLQDRIGHQKAGYPGTDKDELFKSTYRHKHHHPPSWDLCSVSTAETDPVCEAARTLSCQELGCQKDMLISRKRLEIASVTGEPPKPKLHFGSVGSGDTVMKSGEHRDRIAAQHELIAFEMEASGIPSNLQCIVIKAVCDYADSHKNKYWQDYAAAAATAGLICALEEFTCNDLQRA